MIAVVVALAFVLWTSGMIAGIAHSRGFAPLTTLETLPLLAVCAVVSLIVHEGGHLAAGAALGWRCVRLGIGPWEFYRQDRLWKRRRVKMLWGAFVRQMPSTFHHYRREKATTLCSGPFASLCFGWSFALVAWKSSAAGVFAFFSLLAMATLLGVLELIPYQLKGMGSDGYRLWEVLRGGEGVDRLMRDTLAESSNFTTARYRDWPHDVVCRLAAANDPYNIYLALLHTMDAGDRENATRYARRLIALLPEVNPSAHFACEAAYWLALYGEEAGEAKKWLDRAGEDVEPEVRLRAEAAVALAEGQFERAESLSREALSRLGALLDCGANRCEIEGVKAVLERATAGPRSPYFSTAGSGAAKR